MIGEPTFVDTYGRQMNELQVILDNAAEGNVQCSSEYHRWEDEVTKQYISPLGFENICWSSLDWDSFGPLVRQIKATRNGITLEAMYG